MCFCKVYCAEQYIQCPSLETKLLSYHKTIFFACLFSQINNHLMINVNKRTRFNNRN